MKHPAPGTFTLVILGAFGGVAGCRSLDAPQLRRGTPVLTTLPAPVAPPAATRPSTASRPAAIGSWISLFDGKSLENWKVLEEGAFTGHAAVEVRDGTMLLKEGKPETGISYRGGDFPRDNYEVKLQAMRVNGSDFFCGMTFPVGTEPCTLIVGGWGGMVVGLSNVDGMSAAENQTTQGMEFENGRWYAIRLRVTSDRIQAWIDDRQMIDLERKGHAFSVWFEQEPVQPFGVSAWYTEAALKDIRVRRLTPA